MLAQSAALAAVLPSAPQGKDLGQTIRDAVDQATQEAQQEIQQAQARSREDRQRARESQQQVREAQQQVREAQQQVREAQQQLREARTADQRGAAQQAIFAAEQTLREAERELRRVESQTSTEVRVYTDPDPNPNPSFPQIPGAAVDVAIGFFITCAVIVVGWPISRAFGRRLERRGAPAEIDTGVAEQLQRIEQAVEAVAIEVERISESQRFLTRLQEKSATTAE